MRAYIKSVGTYLPGEPVTNEELAAKFDFDLKASAIKMIFGSEHRYLADKDTQCSDLGTRAAQKILTEENKSEIDFMIFAATTADMIEPATGNMVQNKLGLSCPTMDIKNACNSFVSAFQVASSFIESGMYKNILIVSGEKTSDGIYFKAKSFEELKSNVASLSFGDAGSAVWVSGTDNGRGLYHQKFLTLGKYWNLSTVPGGGSVHPKDGEKNYFAGDTAELIRVLSNEGPLDFFNESLEEFGYNIGDFDLVITHQVATHVRETLAELLRCSSEKVHGVFKKYGNTASASLPLALEDALISGKAKEGDKILLLGLAAGISVSIQIIIL